MRNKFFHEPKIKHDESPAELVKVSLYNYRCLYPYYEHGSKTEYVFEKNAAVALLASMKEDSGWGFHICSWKNNGERVAVYDSEGHYHEFTLTQEWRNASNESGQSFRLSIDNAKILKKCLNELEAQSQSSFTI